VLILTPETIKVKVPHWMSAQDSTEENRMLLGNAAHNATEEEKVRLEDVSDDSESFDEEEIELEDNR
jgi:hypothetical protein